MLKYRLIFGVLFSTMFVGLIWADSAMARVGYTPNGTFVALATAVLVPFALREMQGLLGKGGVILSLRLATIACLLCALWPWFEQVAEQGATGRETATAVTAPSSVTADAPANTSGTPPASAWVTFGAKVRTVKPHYLVPTVLAAAMLAALAHHSRKQKVQGAMASAGGTLLAIVYLGVLPGFFLPICLTHTSWMLLAIICIVKSADIGAYTVGHLVGRHKLIPWLSPGKTMEGFLGGLVFSGIAGAAAAGVFRHFTWPQGLLAGVVLGAVGQIGDLLESLLKRDAGVKDSGVVPGFGGVLDILDSPLLAAPAAYWLLKLLVRQ